MTASVAPAISISGLRKSFGPTLALDGLDLTVNAGEVHGFLGPNGAGKTTTIRILLALLHADAGRVQVLGQDARQDAFELHRRLAYVPGDVALWPNLTGGEVIDLIGRMRGSLNTRRKSELIERFDLNPKKKARTYSTGNRQKVMLIAALASEAELLVLDEPTSGLDPLMEVAFRDCVKEDLNSGRTVLLSSHILSEVEALCQRVTIIRAGRTVETGTLSELRHLTRTSIEAEVNEPLTRLDEVPGVHDLQIDDHTVRCEVDASQLSEVVSRLAAAGLRSMTSRPPTLEELFLRHYADDSAMAEQGTR
ncbi:ABC transporter ATP-binding protein [Spirillospora sp. NBC_00431]